MNRKILLCSALMMGFLSFYLVGPRELGASGRPDKPSSDVSWYGKDFHGKETASGSIFNMYDFTCAHRSFPFGIRLKVTNVLTNASTLCEINDRGPFIRGRALDLSYAAAKEIGMIYSGIASVTIEHILDSAYIYLLRQRLLPFMKRLKKEKTLYRLLHPAYVTSIFTMIKADNKP